MLFFSYFLQVVGMEDFPVPKTMMVSDKFNQHLDALRSRFPEFTHTIFVVAPECNMGRHSSELWLAVEKHREETPFHKEKIMVLDDDDTNTGIRTGGKNPVMSKDNLRATAAAAVNGLKIRFHVNMVSVCDVERDVTPSVLIDRLVDQLQRYGADVERSNDLSKPAKLTWHGKRGSLHDDLAMALQLNLAANIILLNQ